MTRTASFTTQAAKALSRRRTIAVELPEFAIRARSIAAFRWGKR